MVSCEAKTNFEGLNNNYQMYGIGTLSGNMNIGSTLRFKLYPKNLTDLAYRDNHVMITDGKLVDLYLYQGSNGNDFGIMVTDLKCFKQLVEFFASIKKELIVDKIIDKTISKVALLGYILHI